MVSDTHVPPSEDGKSDYTTVDLFREEQTVEKRVAAAVVPRARSPRARRSRMSLLVALLCARLALQLPPGANRETDPVVTDVKGLVEELGKGPTCSLHLKGTIYLGSRNETRSSTGTLLVFQDRRPGGNVPHHFACHNVTLCVLAVGTLDPIAMAYS